MYMFVKKNAVFFYQSQRNLVEMSHLEEAHEGFVYKVIFLKIFD